MNMKEKEYIPFPVGTIRGPYYTTENNTVHFMVQGKNGWAPFVRDRKYEKECRESAKKYSKKVLANKD